MTNVIIHHSSFIKAIAILILSLCLVSCQSQHTPVGMTAQVERVVSGQTIEVVLTSVASNQREKVRLIGIMAPDLKQQPWGVAAKDKLEELLRDKKGVVLESETETKDRFGRIPAYLWQNGHLVNEQLLREGYVLADLQFPHKYSKIFIRAQEYARIMGYGIWNPQQPMRLTPKEFRRLKS